MSDSYGPTWIRRHRDDWEMYEVYTRHMSYAGGAMMTIIYGVIHGDALPQALRDRIEAEDAVALFGEETK